MTSPKLKLKHHIYFSFRYFFIFIADSYISPYIFPDDARLKWRFHMFWDTRFDRHVLWIHVAYQLKVAYVSPMRYTISQTPPLLLSLALFFAWSRSVARKVQGTSSTSSTLELRSTPKFSIPSFRELDYLVMVPFEAHVQLKFSNVTSCFHLPYTLTIFQTCWSLKELPLPLKIRRVTFFQYCSLLSPLAH